MPSLRRDPRDLWRTLAGVALMSVLYFAAAHAGYQYLSASNVSMVWLPSGVALGLLIRFGLDWTPGIFIGSFLFSLSVGSPVWVSAGVAMSNTLQTVMAWWLLRRFTGHASPFTGRAALARFLLWGAGLGTIIGACTALPFASVGENWDFMGYVAGWLSWWLGDALGVVLVTPLILAVTHEGFRPSRHQWIEVAMVVGWVVVCAAGVLLLQQKEIEPLLPLTFLLLPPLAWAALNFGERGTTIVLLFCATTFLWDAGHDKALIQAAADDARHWGMNLALLTTSLTTLLVLAIVNEHRQAEEQIRQINASLEQRVRERTAQLLAANQEMQAFSYSVSHDLRAPLRHIAGFTGLLESSPAVKADPETVRFIGIVSDAVRKMGQLIDDLLLFSRMGRVEMKREPVSMRHLIDEIRTELAVEAGDRHIDWRVQDLPAVQGDPAMLRQVWVNLLGNAVKYTRRQPRAVIEVTCRQNNGEWIFSVKDNGAGFDMQYADKLFGVFQRLHREEEFEGTGIGLANVRRIVHRHGGLTWAVGAVNAGATFSFSMPRGEA